MGGGGWRGPKVGGMPNAVSRIFFQPLLPPESGSLYFFKYLKS